MREHADADESSGAGEGHHISIIGWIVLGLIAGFIGSKIVNKTGEGFFLDIVLGIAGAIVGGFLFTAVGATRDLSRVNLRFHITIGSKWR